MMRVVPCHHCNDPLVLIGYNGTAIVSDQHPCLDGFYFCDGKCASDWIHENHCRSEVYDPRDDPDIGDMA